MTHHFAFTPGPTWTELCLLGPDGAPVPVDRWALEAPDDLLPGVDLVGRLEAADAAIKDGDLVLVEHRAVAALSSAQGASLGLPRLAEAVAHIAGRGLITRPDFRVALDWATPLGQPILGAARIGPFLCTGSAVNRLPEVLFDLAEAVDALNRVEPADAGGRLATLAVLREVLPAGAAAGLAEATGLVGHMTIAVADAFSLDLKGEGAGAVLVPVLHRAKGEPDAPLLPPEQQVTFGQKQFNGFSDARAVYTLGQHWYVVLQPPLRRALSEVRRINGASPATRRAFLANPRAYLREALGEEADEVVLDGVFRETAAYANRVLGLGLWTPRVVPWVKLPVTDWFAERLEAPQGRYTAPVGGLDIDGRRIPLDPSAAASLKQAIETAITAGGGTVPFRHGDEIIALPATPALLDALRALEEGRAAVAMHRAPNAASEAPQVLLIKPNEETLDVESLVQPSRPAPPPGTPRGLATTLKRHQEEGLAWLQRAWAQGVPGVLLADDMGLGKTLQGLAFLAWLRDGMETGTVPRAPLLVVAPTGLLQNWRAEHDRHLAAPGLGRCVPAYGRDLAALKRPAAGSGPGLDVERLAQGDWVLTTYETLRDYHTDFGRVRFAALLFDEAQKIKTPGIRLTDAAKAMQAEFQVALTGTPVENRLADLWCIVDTIQPGWLGELKGFSARYERALDEAALCSLKGQLERSFGGRPPLMLRRLKHDRLPDLPPSQDHFIPRPMPPIQRDAYRAAIGEARTVQAPGAVLKALQALRAISLHPQPEAPASDDAFVAASARLTGAFDALDDIARAGERALIFLGDLAMQARLAGLIQRRYGLPAPPMIINGGVAGALRQARVDAFQTAGEGFDAMILSPQAGGVGLTLTRANHVIHLSRWWNPAVEDQCTGRVLRIGQIRPVSIHIPLAVQGDGAPSFDDNLSRLLDRKRRLMQDALMPSDATRGADIEQLFMTTIQGANY